MNNTNGTAVGVTTLGALNDGGAARTISKGGAGTMTPGTAASSLVTGTAVNITGGILNSNNATALGSLANVTLSGGTTLNVGASQTLGALNNASGGTVTLGANTLTVGSTNNLASSYGGGISGSGGSLIKAGTNTLTLSGTNTYTGGTTISAGTLALGSSDAIGTTGTISFTGGTLQSSASNTTDYSARFSNAASQAYSLDTNGESVALATALSSTFALFKVANVENIGNLRVRWIYDDPGEVPRAQKVTTQLN